MILSRALLYVVPKRVNSNITSRVDTCISSTRVSRILVQFPLYSPSFSNCPPLSIDTSHATFHDTFVPLPVHTLTYVPSFSDLLRETCLYPGRVNCSPKALEKPSFPQNCLFSLQKLQRSDKLNTIRKKRSNSFSKRFLNRKKEKIKKQR